MSFLKRVRTTRLGYLGILLVLIWLKTLFAYYVDFSLGANGLLQQILLIINPIGTSFFLLTIALYIHNPKRAYAVGFIIYFLMTVLLIANVLYYREFTDFMTINTILGVSKVSQGLGASSLHMLVWHDLVYGFDFILILLTYAAYAVVNIWRYLNNQKLRWPHFGLVLDQKRLPFHLPQALSCLALAMFGVTMATSELNRPQLLTRTFDHNYIVKYLGLLPFTVYDGIQTAQNTQTRAQADASDMDAVVNFTKHHYAAPNPAYFGAAKGKNVIIIHMESFQQFLIGMKVDGKPVTPFLNSLIKQKDTLSFDNFFHQVGQGKTSDAENLLETSTFGLPTGSLFTSLGTDNTFEGAPAILDQSAGYTSAVFHGGSGGFWNRNNVYRSLGYNYFFDGNFYNHDNNASTEYGIKDKLMFAETSKYMEHLQQPFYAKIITTTNHYPFFITDTDSDFPNANTSDAYINGYFRTAHYLDQALKEYFTYLNTSGLAKNSIVMLYGDHFGISNDRNPTLAPLLGKSASDWTSFDDAQLQRVPLILHMPGLKGGIDHTYGGEVDVLPTLLHLLGVDSHKYVQFGTDLMSKHHDAVVAFRNHNFVTPKYTVLSGKIYANKDGSIVTPDAKLQTQIDRDQQSVNQRLELSDTLANKNLLRYYVPTGFTPIDPEKTNFTQSLHTLMTTEDELGKKSTSLWAKNGDKTTTSGYKTDAPEVANDHAAIDRYPEKVKSQIQTAKDTAKAESSSVQASKSSNQ